MADGVLIVTGGGRGIGAAVCRLGAAAGYAVVVNYAANRAAADEVVAAIEASGGTAVAVKADVRHEADVMSLFEAADRLGPLAALVNNAGVIDAPARVDELSYERLRRMFDINVIGSILCAREAAKRLSTRHGGRGGGIVNVSSSAAKLGSPGEYPDYAAAKGAIDTFTVGLAKELADEGVRVNAVRPGLIETEIHASGGQPDRVERLKEMVPMRRGGTAEEVANAILWLLSDASSYTTGASIDVSGGRTTLP